MSDAIRIKRFLKKGIQAKILTTDQLLMMRADDLLDVNELHGIEEAVIEKTLEDIKLKIHPTRSKQPLKNSDEENIMRMIEKRAGLYLDDVKKIFYS